MKPLKRFFNLLRQDRKDLVYLYVYAIFNGLINLSLPIGIQAIMGLVLAGRLSASWGILTLVVMAGVAVAGVFQLMQLYVVEILQRRLFARAAFEFAYRIPKFRLKKLGNYYAPELVNRFFDTVTIQKSLSKILIDFFASSLQIIFGLILLSLYHPVFIAFGLFMIMVLILIIYLTSKRGLETSIAESNNKYEMAFWLTELARALPTFKLAGRTDLNLNKTDTIVNKYISSRKKHFKVLLNQYASIIGLKTIITAGLLIIGALLLISNSITIGQFVASEIVIILILGSSEKLIMSMDAIYDVLTAVEKLGKVTDVEIERDTQTGIVIKEKGALQVEMQDVGITGVSSNYLFNQKLSLVIKPGTTVCLSGPPGSGKSSLVKILSSSLDNFTGTILYDDVPVQNLNIQSLRNHIGCVFDDQDIFYGTFMENMTLGREDVTPEEVIKLAREVGLDTMIQSFEEGYDHVILNSERIFSGTDRVRLLLVRALVGQPRLVLTEDLFSGLRQDNREYLLNWLVEKCENTTLVMVSNNHEIHAKCNEVIELK